MLEVLYSLYKPDAFGKAIIDMLLTLKRFLRLNAKMFNGLIQKETVCLCGIIQTV